MTIHATTTYYSRKLRETVERQQSSAYDNEHAMTENLPQVPSTKDKLSTIVHGFDEFDMEMKRGTRQRREKDEFKITELNNGWCKNSPTYMQHKTNVRLL